MKMRTVLLIALVSIVFSEANGQGCTSEIKFNIVNNRSDRADFTALPPSNSPVGQGSKLSCECENKKRALWTDPNELTLPTAKAHPAFRDSSREGNVSKTVLTIRGSFSCYHAGVYTCKIGTSSSRVLVTPSGEDCSPKNVSITAVPSGSVAKGTEITFTCSAANPTNTSLRYSWSANGEELLGENGTSVVVPVKEDTSITCSVSNDVGNSSATTAITVAASVEPTPTAFLSSTSQPVPPSDVDRSSPTTSDTSSVSSEYTSVKTTVIESSKLVASSAQVPSDVSATSHDTSPQTSVSEGTMVPGDSPSVSMETSIDIQYTKAIMETAVSTSTSVPGTSLSVHTPSLLMSSSSSALLTSPMSISSSLTLGSTPSPSDSTPSLSVPTPSPLVSTPSPSISTRSPVPTPSLSVSTPTQSVSTPSPVPTPSPSVSTPSPSVTTSSPSVSTPSPSVPSPSPSSSPPPVVQKPNSSFVGDKVSIEVTWSVVEGAENITVGYTWRSLWTDRTRRQESDYEEVTLGPQNTSYTVEDAEGYSRYCFTITANYANGVSSPAREECVDTPTTKPSAPVGVEFPDTRSTSFVVKWALPERPNGVITGFKVFYNKTDATHTLNVTYDMYLSNGKQVTIDGLSVSTRYLVGVVAVNSAGEGPMTGPEAVFTKAGQPLIGTNIIIAIIVACLVVILLILICIVALCIIVLKCKTKKARRTFDARWWVEPTNKEERVGLEELESQRNGKSDSSQNAEAGMGSKEDIQQPTTTTTSFFVQMKDQQSSP